MIDKIKALVSLNRKNGKLEHKRRDDGVIEIENTEDFLAIRSYLNSEEQEIFELQNEIDFYNLIDDYIPIGTDEQPFNHVLKGNDEYIKNVQIELNDDYLGLFGVIGEDGEVVNLNIEHVYIKGATKLGTITGVNNGVISRCSVEKNPEKHNYEVKGTKEVGSVVGINNGIIEHTNSTVDATGHSIVGGLVGVNNGEMSEVATKNLEVDTDEKGGAFIGVNTGSLINAGATNGFTFGNTKTGAIVGVNEGTISCVDYIGVLHTTGRERIYGRDTGVIDKTTAYIDKEKEGKDQDISLIKYE